ncbi:uncharacterized protein LOC127751470 [Frankliniella occidentalis]|uniref:Uncharacterized protein LOC127751470 n=1 Tax=Frankliniella occidentalis TaxID=133901 RepID=A0A9C6X8F2_FRAOC|nr:uncharacterized protein LOC127751470 [Frankliniella occidentalis]
MEEVSVDESWASVCREQRDRTYVTMAVVYGESLGESMDLAQLMWGVENSKTVPSYEEIVSSIGITPSEQVQNVPSAESAPVEVRRGRPKKVKNVEPPKQTKKTGRRPKDPRVKVTKCKKVPPAIVKVCKRAVKNEKTSIGALYRSLGDICHKMSELCKILSK